MSSVEPLSPAFTPAWLASLTQLVGAHKQDDPMAPVTVLVPSNIAGIVARRHLARGLHERRNGIAAIWFTTLPRLAEQLAAPSLHAQSRRPASTVVVAATIRDVLRREPGVFADVAEHPATVQAIARAHRELRDVDDEALDSISATSAMSGDLVRVHRRVCDLLAEQWYDETDLLIRARDLIAQGAADIAQFGAIIDYLPRDLTRREQQFRDALAEASTLAGAGAVSGVGAPAGAGAGPVGIVEAPSKIAHYADQVIDASDSDDEVRTVVRRVVAALRTTPAHRIAVLYTDRQPYARLLHEQLTTAGVLINGAGVRPVLERSLPRFVLGLLETARMGWNRTDLMRTLGTVPVQGPDGERIPLARWERISRDSGVVHQEDWSSRLATYRQNQLNAADQADGSDWPERASVMRSNAERADALSQFVAGLRHDLLDLEDRATWAAAAASLTRLLERLVPRELRDRMPLEEKYANGVLERAIDGLGAMDLSGSTPTLSGVEDALLHALENALPRVGRFGEGVFVGPVSDATGLSLDEVFIVGMSEDLCPGRLPDDSLLPRRVREHSLGQLRPIRHRLTRTESDLASAFASAQRVTASFSRGDLRKQSSRLPSRWLMPTFRELGGAQTLAATKYDTVHGSWRYSSPSYAGAIASTESPSSEQEWRLRALTSGVPIEADAIQEYDAVTAGRSGSEFSPYDGNLSDASGLPRYTEDDRVLSASSLEEYAKCPHGWFVKRLLRIEPVEDPDDQMEITTADVGNIIHESFDRWITEQGEAGSLPDYGVPWTPEQAQRLQQIGADVAGEYEAAGRTGHPRTWARRRSRILAALATMVHEDSEWRAKIGARVVGSELRFGMEATSAAVELDTDAGTVRFRGSIDKVDQTRDGTVIVTDIKTGSARSFRVLSADNPVANGEKLQLPLYAQAARQLVGSPDTKVEAAYWFTYRDSKRIPLELTESVAATYRTTIGALVDGIHRGLFPQRAPDKPDFLRTECVYCNPDGIGHAEARRRWEQLREVPALRQYVETVEPDVIAQLDADSEMGDAHA